MNIEEKLSKANEITSNLEKVNMMLKTIRVSKGKKSKSIDRDSYPSSIKLISWHCTGSDGYTQGDHYSDEITDKELLVKVFHSVEVVLLAEKRALEAELTALIG